MKKISTISLAIFTLFLAGLACSLIPSAAPTQSTGSVYTQAVETVIAKLTENALASQALASLAVPEGATAVPSTVT